MALGGDCHGSTEPLRACYNRNMYLTSVVSFLTKAKMVKYVKQNRSALRQEFGRVRKMDFVVVVLLFPR